MWGPEMLRTPGRRKGPLPVPAPKLKLPGHERVTDHLGTHGRRRGRPLTEPEEGQDFVPKQHDSLRRVGVYEKDVQSANGAYLRLCPRN